MPRRSIFGEAKVRKVECRSKRQLDYAETKLKNNLGRLCAARVEASARGGPPMAFSAGFAPQRTE